jgi:predicted PurR-regulated permease PerM
LYVLIVLATLTGLFILWQFREALLLFLLSLAIAAAFRPLIDFFTSQRLPHGIALLLSYLLILGLTVGILALIGGPLLRDIEQATNEFITTYERIRLNWPESEILFQQMLANQLPPSQELFGSLVNEDGFKGLM